MRHPRSRAACLAVAVVCSSLMACATPYYAEPPPPAPAPAPRGLRVTAQRKQSQRQQDRDKADCMNMANGQATSETTWAQIFTSCMGGRGYMID